MGSKSQVTLTFTGKDKELTKTFNHVEKQSDKLNKAFGLMATGVAAGGVAAVTAAVAAGGALFELGRNFDSAHDNIVAGTGASGEALDGLKKSFDNVLTSVPTNFGDASTAIADVNTALGLTGEPLEALSKQFINLSRVSKEDLGGGIQSVTRLFGDWGVAVEDQSLTMDKLWTVSQATGIGVGQLSDQLVKTGAPLRQLGFDMDQSAALFGKWNKEGVNTDIIFSGVRQSISKFAREGKNIPEAFKGATQAIKDAGTASEATSLAIEIFGAEAGPDMAAAIREGRFEVEELVAQMNDAEGAISRTAKDTESFGEKWQLFKNQMAVAFKPAAMAIFEGLGKVMEKVAPILTDTVIPGIERFIGSLTTLKAAFTEGDDFGADGLEGAMAKIGLALKAAKDFIVDDFVPAVKRAVDKFREIWEEIGPDVTRIMAQIGNAVKSGMEFVSTLITRTVDFIQFVWRNWGEEITFVAGWAFDLIVGVIDGALKIVEGIFQTASAILRGDWQGMWDGIKTILDGAWTVIKAILNAAWESLKATARLAWSATKAIIFDKLNLIKSDITRIIGLAVQLLSDKWNAAKRKTVETWDAIKTKVSNIATGVKTAVTNAFNSIVSFMGRIPGRIARALSGLASKVTKPFRDAYNGATEWLNKIPGVGSVVGGFSSAIRGFGGAVLHDGGTFHAPTAGGEGLALLRDQEQVFTPEQVHALGQGMNSGGGGGGGGGGEVLLRIDSAGSQMDRVIVELLRKAINNQGGDVQAVLGAA